MAFPAVPLQWHNDLFKMESSFIKFDHTCRETNIVPVSTDRQPIAKEFIGHIELVVLGILPNTLKVLQLDTHDHVFGLCQQVDMVIAQPELTSTAGGKKADKGGGMKENKMRYRL